MKRGSSVESFLQPLADKPVQAYLTDELQVPDLLEWILDQVGRSDIIQTTFSISEEYLRRLNSIRSKGLVDRLDLILDFKATNKTVDLWVFMSNVVDSTYLSENHSKIILVRSRSGRKVVVITSQSLTRGNRAESTAVIESDDIFDSIYDQVQDILCNNSIMIDDLLSATD